MRHLKGYRKLGRNPSHRRALLRNLTTSMVLHERIQTTLPKAKELRSLVEKMVTYGKKGDLHSRRLASSYLFDKEAVKKLFTDLGPRFKERQGGYTRILRHGKRFSDGAQIASIEFVDFEFKPKEQAKDSSAEG